ncbi:uncharacterized protein LOC125279307 [Megalobrama amblycephala]|uniref:uncharacterized protein LOC125257725 n=2 Tax=Megalobrama amblycephala TaxID=75352 RepID=UPI002014618E|nr:uncharacterized protein LOC125257725 [Megalobrama amblycephala]XP_048064096.1 uncharacterized protein LOC125278803 [Megalobrama amblycephala]XP_048064773.1 uncharacterized protein LOC125279307 [Megalobrama amblycephala]
MSIHSEENRDVTVRSRRRTQMPRYLEDYEVDYVPEQRSAHTPSNHSNEGEQLIGATGGPLPPHNTLVAGIDHFPAYEGNPHFSPEALQMRLKDLEEENRQLRRNLSEQSAPHTPRSLSPSQLFCSPRHLTRNMEDRTSPPHHKVTSTRDQRDPRYERERSVKHSEDNLHAERQRDRIDEIILELQRMKVSSKQFRSTSPSPERAPQRAERADECYHQPRQLSTHYYSPSSRRQRPFMPHRSSSPPSQENTYRGPTPTIPNFTKEDPREFTRLKVALDNLLPADVTERFKFQILMDHLKFEEALLIADSYSNSRYPYSHTMQALTELYGQPHQLALKRIAVLMDGPSIRSGDTRAFRLFALKVRALVGMLDQLGSPGHTELTCGSHVSRLLAKLPHDLRANFKRYVNPLKTPIPTLTEFAEWLEYEVRVQEDGTQFSIDSSRERQSFRKDQQRVPKLSHKSTAIFHGSEQSPVSKTESVRQKTVSEVRTLEKPKKYCPFCNTTQHYLNQCSNFKLLTKEQIVTWIRSNQRCWKCGRDHQAGQCTLKAKCKKCQRRHLEILHEANNETSTTNIKERGEITQSTSTTIETLYVNRPTGSSRVLLKLCRVIIRNGDFSLDTYALLDDGSERTILLHEAAQQLNLHGKPEDLSLRTVRQDVRIIHGSTVSFSVSPATQPDRNFAIKRAFTAEELGLAPHSYPIETLQKRYRHLRGLPLQSIDHARPLLLIGSDYPQLITPVEPVRLGPPGGPAAVKTRLGWTLQGPSKFLEHIPHIQQCLFTAVSLAPNDLFSQVERLWQMDILPYQNERLVTRSKQDAEAIRLLEEKTMRVDVEGVQRYATPLLWKISPPPLAAPKEAVLPHLRRTENQLAQSSEKSQVYKSEMNKLLEAGYVKKIPQSTAVQTPGWYIPHHMVHHNGKHRIVFNCSFNFQGLSLNEYLLPGPTLGATLLGVLLRFREYAVAISSDIKGMFHQVRLLPEDKAFLRFLWRDLKPTNAPDVYQWSVLPFGTTCSPCCATFALRKHVADHSQPDSEVRASVDRCFYVDNWLQSFPSLETARQLVDDMRHLLAEGGFELRQWATNTPQLLQHLPQQIRSENHELWFSSDRADPQERTLGLRWQCRSDTLGYKHGHVVKSQPTMRHIYSILSSQYDPLGFITPFTTRAKIIVQRLWDKKREWDDPELPTDLRNAWLTWEDELPQLSCVTLPRCYTTKVDPLISSRSVHTFCDASERAYGAVAYLRTEDSKGQVEVSFLAARSRVAPKKQQTIPRLELCAALTGAQLAAVLKTELSLDISSFRYWTDSTTVLNWLQSDSCHFKVFVGTRVAEIQELTDSKSWVYVHSQDNPADDITRGMSLAQLAKPTRWKNGPEFLQKPPSSWPKLPNLVPADTSKELRKPVSFHLLITEADQHSVSASQYDNFQELVDATARTLHGAASPTDTVTADTYKKAELRIIQQSQMDSFPDEYAQLQAGKPISSNSRLKTLSPEFDSETQLIRVGGRLRRCRLLSPDILHPIVLDPIHSVTKLLIRQYDAQLHHPGTERVFAEIRRRFWILRGRQAIRSIQYQCTECQRWRGKPNIPKMADLPPSSLRLFQPAFYSTGMDCFGPFTIKIGRRNEKRWGIIYKCLTTKAVYIDLLSQADTDSFLMSLRRFISRRGKPHELCSDQGTNFKGGDRELKESFNNIHPQLQRELAKQQIDFQYNPPNSPHFGGSWEREIRSVKAALYTTIGAQTVTEEVLRTVLIEIEGILNSKPLGYVSSDVADPDPITPNSLLMGRSDSALPQVIYPASELLSRKRWRHSQILADQFWSCYLRNYLPGLQSRHKWQQEKDNLTVGTVVMIADPQFPRAFWPIGTVKAVHTGADNKVRAAEIQVKDRTYIRPVVRLIKLPSLPE